MFVPVLKYGLNYNAGSLATESRETNCDCISVENPDMAES